MAVRMPPNVQRFVFCWLALLYLTPTPTLLFWCSLGSNDTHVLLTTRRCTCDFEVPDERFASNLSGRSR